MAPIPRAKRRATVENGRGTEWNTQLKNSFRKVVRECLRDDRCRGLLDQLRHPTRKDTLPDPASVFGQPSAASISAAGAGQSISPSETTSVGSGDKETYPPQFQTLVQFYGKHSRFQGEMAAEIEAAFKRDHERKKVHQRQLEIVDPPMEFTEKVAKVARMVAECKEYGQRVIFHTGAGLSTSCGIRDFRGQHGLWTLTKNKSPKEWVGTFDGHTPSLGHWIISHLLKRGYITAVVTQNVDGLHRHAGVPWESLVELHGNAFVEECARCGRKYERTYDVTKNSRKFRHLTGRICADKDCNGPLQDTLVHFGETIRNVETAQEFCLGSALAVSLGSTLRVPPASSLPGLSAKYVVVNLQWTSKDKLAALKLHAHCDDFLAELWHALGLGDPRDIIDAIQMSTGTGAIQMSTGTGKDASIGSAPGPSTGSHPQ